MVGNLQLGTQNRNPPIGGINPYCGGINGCQGTEGLWMGRVIVPGSYLPDYQRHVNPVLGSHANFIARITTISTSCSLRDTHIIGSSCWCLPG
jgi:hypothetical protein